MAGSEYFNSYLVASWVSYLSNMLNRITFLIEYTVREHHRPFQHKNIDTLNVLYTNYHSLFIFQIVLFTRAAQLLVERRVPRRTKKANSSLVEDREGSYLPNCQTNLVIALDALSHLYCIFINRTAYHLGRYEPSSPISCRALRKRSQYTCAQGRHL